MYALGVSRPVDAVGITRVGEKEKVPWGRNNPAVWIAVRQFPP